MVEAGHFMPIVLTIQEAEIGQITVPYQSRQKKCLILHLNGKSWAWWHVPVIVLMAGSLK
jgi:hypothetical protein